MIARTAPDVVLRRFWVELHRDPALGHLLGIVVPPGAPATDPAGLALSDLVALIPMVPLIAAALNTPEQQLAALDAAVHAYARAAGLSFLEE